MVGLQPLNHNKQKCFKCFPTTTMKHPSESAEAKATAAACLTDLLLEAAALHSRNLPKKHSKSSREVRIRVPTFFCSLF